MASLKMIARRSVEGKRAVERRWVSRPRPVQALAWPDEKEGAGEALQNLLGDAAEGQSAEA